MPITFECACGRKFRTSDDNAGRNATCPDCRAQLVVPAASVGAPSAPGRVLPPPLPVDDPPVPYAMPSEEVVPVPRGPADAAPYGRPRRDDPYGRNDAGRRPAYGRDDDIERIVKRPPARSGGATNGGALAGVAMMIGAVIWFVVGLQFDYIFFYPPILFIIGLITLIKGLVAGGRR